MTAFNHLSGLRLLLLAVLFPVSVYAQATAPADEVRPVKSVNASALPVILKGSQVPALIGTSALNISAFACYGDAFRQVIIQVDELNADERVTSPDPRSKIAKDDQPGVLDPNDEVLFMLHDAGNSCGKERLARARGALVEVKLSPSYLKEPVYIYLLGGDSAVAPSGKRLVRWDDDNQTAYAGGYIWGYDKTHPFMSNRISFTELRGRSEEDMLDRLKVRIKVKTIGNLLNLKVTEDDIDSEIVGVRAGPIRVTREQNLVIHSVPGFDITALVSFQHFERLWRADVRIRFPKSAAMFVSSMDVAFLHDFTDLKGLRLATSTVPQGTSIDGKMLDEEKTIEFGAEPWYFITGNGANQITAIDLDPSLKLITSVVFIDDPDYSDPPESIKGGLPSVGYQYTGWENLQAKTYHFGANITFLSGFPEGGATGYYKTLRAPLKVEARKLEAGE